MAKILIVDDNDDFRQMIRLILSKDGHQVDLASSGEEGLSRFQANPADIVLVDILMPGKGGLETIRDLYVGPKRPRIVAISGGFLGGAEAAADLAVTLGVDRALAKPFSPDQLLRIIKELS